MVPISHYRSLSLLALPQQRIAMAICQYAHRSPSSGVRAGLLCLREKGQDQQGRSKTKCYQAGAMMSYPMTKPVLVLASLAGSLGEDKREEGPKIASLHGAKAHGSQCIERACIARPCRTCPSVRACLQAVQLVTLSLSALSRLTSFKAVAIPSHALLRSERICRDRRCKLSQALSNEIGHTSKEMTMVYFRSKDKQGRAPSFKVGKIQEGSTREMMTRGCGPRMRSVLCDSNREDLQPLLMPFSHCRPSRHRAC